MATSQRANRHLFTTPVNNPFAMLYQMFDGKTIHNLFFTSIDSTNTWAKEHALEFDHSALTCILADGQTAGRGQRDKTWLSPKGNLYTTFFFVLPLDFTWIANLGQIFALSMARVLQEIGFVPELKWPNDILLAGKKAGGVLCETLPLSDGLGVVLGLGLNVNVPETDLNHVGQHATSLIAQSGQPFTLTLLLQQLLLNFLGSLQQLQETGFSSFAAEYNRHLAYKDQEVLFSHPEGTFSAICKGIDETGRLVLDFPDGQQRHFYSGSLRKI